MSSVPSPTERPLGRVAVLGLGLMGGSVARAISSLDLAAKVTGWSPLATERDAALTAGALTLAAGHWPEAVSDADLVILAAPLDATRRLLSSLADAAPETATITDVASLKAPVAEVAGAAGLTDRWVGSHPMTGGERSGFWASRGDLFAGARVWIVADESAADRARAIHGLWTSLGAIPAAIDADEHDRLMAVVSHLPQLVANALATVMSERGVRPDELGPGGRDMTRLAGSSSQMWMDLLACASPELGESLRAVGRLTHSLADAIDEGDMDAIDKIMRDTQLWRRRV